MLGCISQLVPSLESFNIQKKPYNAISQNMHIYKRACPRLQNINLGIFDKNLPKRNISLLKIDDDGFMGIPDF
ncbi:hypothetical protein GGF40_001307 [Coemansia sp. RSA 1286]|nr:hypothetical protein GGF40_001307 [Coemansia sp. RSA 1286]